ncbi:MAG: transglycosylase SLT domain-containing protein [Methyloprofundus sp.]|nr:transglycosylase SLT domain-containing protein [Methyloprofundus sp.]
MQKTGLFLLFVIFWAAECSANIAHQQRDDFLIAEAMLDKGDTENYFLMKSKLKNYPLNFYLDYKFLSKNLDKSIQIQDFFKEHKNSRYTYKLRYKWLSYLYKNKQWSLFVKNYKKTSNLSRQCQYQWARYQLNYKKKALRATQKIWLTGRSLPKACDSLLDVFVQSKFLTQTLIFKRYKNAIKAREFKLASYLYKKIAIQSVKKQAKSWLDIAKTGQLTGNEGIFTKRTLKGRSELFTYAIKRLINQDINTGIAVWEMNRSKQSLSGSRKYKIDRKIALQLAFNKSKKAYSKLIKLNSKQDKTLREWTVRAALIEGNWQHVQKALSRLTARESLDSRWRYWRARAFQELGAKREANEIFSELAQERGFFAFIAADKMQKEYSFNDAPLEVTEEQKKSLLQTRNFTVINEFRILDRHKQAKLYWKNSLVQLDKSELLVAAKIAQHWGWNKLAILSVAQAKNWGDVSLRFPLEYESSIKINASNNELPQSIVYGFIRRESMFDPLAQSPVGALGLMQIMPATGKKIAKDLKRRWRSKSVLLHAETNLKYGSLYYKQMLDKFNGNYALAAAAYNAGPHRVKRWLKFDNILPSDIWIETIPYKETRGYVAAVLAYAIIYQQQLPAKQTLISAFLQDVSSTALNSKLALAKKG